MTKALSNDASVDDDVRKRERQRQGERERESTRECGRSETRDARARVSERASSAFLGERDMKQQEGVRTGAGDRHARGSRAAHALPRESGRGE